MIFKVKFNINWYIQYKGHWCRGSVISFHKLPNSTTVKTLELILEKFYLLLDARGKSQDYFILGNMIFENWSPFFLIIPRFAVSVNSKRDVFHMKVNVIFCVECDFSIEIFKS